MKIVLEVIKGPHTGKTFSFGEHDTFIVGRAKSAKFRLSDDDPFFSRNHFVVEINPPLCRLLDLNSRNGTFVNGSKVSNVDLKSGDRIRGGKTTLQVNFSDALASRQQIGDETIAPRRLRPNTTGPSQATLAPAFPNAGASGRSDDDSRRASDAVEAVRAGEAALQLSGYNIRNVIGQGGMGVIYSAVDETDGATVAVKVIKPTVGATEKDISRFVREAQILQQLGRSQTIATSHPTATSIPQPPRCTTY